MKLNETADLRARALALMKQAPGTMPYEEAVLRAAERPVPSSAGDAALARERGSTASAADALERERGLTRPAAFSELAEPGSSAPANLAELHPRVMGLLASRGMRSPHQRGFAQAYRVAANEILSAYREDRTARSQHAFNEVQREHGDNADIAARARALMSEAGDDDERDAYTRTRAAVIKAAAERAQRERRTHR